MNPYLTWALEQIETNGSQWNPLVLEEGPRIIGHCAYCAGPCSGSTSLCEMRVYSDARVNARKSK